jgi:hypothetical protein
VRIALACLVLGGCLGKKTFPCESSSACASGGSCIGGWCAFMDPTCPAGYRFGELAGDGLANTCLGVADAGPDAADFTCPGHPPGWCDVFTGCGCDTAGGDKCVNIADTGVSCVHAGTLPVGASCTDDECVSGAICILPLPVCLAYCDASHPCADSAHVCLPFADTAGVVDGSLCLPTCDVVAQDCGFPGVACFTETAVVSDVDRGVCYGAGDVPQDGACAQFDSCAAGLGCFNYVCGTYCATASPSCPANHFCQALGNGSAAGICLEICDPLAPSCAASGAECVVDESVGVDRGLCWTPPGPGASGSTCNYTSDCAPGLTCSTESLCRYLCDVQAPSCPEAGTHCAVLPGETRVGACTP